MTRRAGSQLGRRHTSARGDPRPGSQLARRHTSAIADELPITERLTIPLSEITLRASRSSGPGGQHANVTASRIEAVFDVRASGALSEVERQRLLARCGPIVTAVAQDARSQARNRDLALARLAERLARGLAVPRQRHRTKPTAASARRRLDAKRRAAERKRGRFRPGADDD